MKSVMTHGALALVGLALAWSAWTEEVSEEISPDAVELIDCGEDGPDEVALLSERRDTTLQGRGEGDDRYYWITVERRASDGEATTKEFAGGDAVDELATKLGPFRAERSLGTVDADRLPDLDLAPDPPDDEEGEGEGEQPAEPAEWSPTRLRITCGERTRTFIVGGTTFGLPRRYLMGEDGGPVFLVDAQVVSDLEAAEHRLMQRNLLRFELTDVDTMVVEAFGESRTLKHRHRSDARRAEWVDASAPDRRNELYGNWLDRFGRLTVQEYLDVDAEPGADLEGAPSGHEVVLRVEYRGDDGETKDVLELARVDAEPVEYYARTRATRAWVKVIRTVAQQVEDDARPVVGLPAIEREEPAPSTPDAGAPTAPTPEGEGAPAPEGAPPPPPPVPRSPHGADPHAGHGHSGGE